MRKYASAVVLSAEMGGREATFRTAHRHSFRYEKRPGYLYVRSRAISSRCNDNYDEFPAEEIKLGYRSFVGKPVFVNHKNDDHRRARGVIIDAALHEDINPDGSPDTWCEVLMEVDAVRFPKLAKAILAGEVDRTSMGTDVAYSKCSFCGNKASTPLEYCQHIPKLKGKRIRRTTASGAKEDVLVREICYGLSFFENSLLVEEPADPTAFFLGVEGEGVQATGMAKTAAQEHQDAEWTTWAAVHPGDRVCPPRGATLGEMQVRSSGRPFGTYKGTEMRQGPTDLRPRKVHVVAYDDGTESIHLADSKKLLRVPKTAAAKREASLDAVFAKVCGEFDVSDYSPADCPSWQPYYFASWLMTDGKVLAVTGHDDAPGHQAGAFSNGWVRMMVTNYPKAPYLQAESHRWPFTQAQVSAFRKLADELEVDRSIIVVTESPVGNGTYTVPTAQLFSFLKQPVPEGGRSGGSMLEYMDRYGSLQAEAKSACPGTGRSSKITEGRDNCPVCGFRVYVSRGEFLRHEGERNLGTPRNRPGDWLSGMWASKTGALDDAFVKLAEWTSEDEKKHPRGQPDNPGQFAPKGEGGGSGAGGSGGAPAPSAPKKSKAPEEHPPGSPGQAPKKPGTPMRKDIGAYTADTDRDPKAPPGSQKNPLVVTSVDLAVDALLNGDWVVLKQPRQISTLVDKLGKMQEWIKDENKRLKEEWVAAGKDPEKFVPKGFNLCHVMVPKTNIFCHDNKDIPRIKMPQLKASNPLPGSKADALERDKRGEVDINGLFKERLREMGVKVTDKDENGNQLTEKASYLKATQNELQGDKVGGIAGALKAGVKMEGAVFVSSDNYIVDGHHRWAAMVANDLENGQDGEIDMEIDRIDLDIMTILRMANDFCAEYGLPAQDAHTFAGASSAPAKAAALDHLFTLAYGESKAPADVDTLRDAACPVCGEETSYDGQNCLVCGFVKPPDMFMDPDLEKAQQVDLRQQEDDVTQPGDKPGQALTCDQCGAQFPKSAEAPGAEAQPEAQPDPAKPHTHPEEAHPDAQHGPEAHPDKPHPHGADDEAGDEDKPEDAKADDGKVPVEVDDGSEDQDEIDPETGKPRKKKPPFVKGSSLDAAFAALAAVDTKADPPPLKAPELPHQTDKEQKAEVEGKGDDMPDTAPEAGDTCPECGKGTLRPDSPAATKQQEVPPGKDPESEKKDAPPWAKDDKSKGKDQKESSVNRPRAAPQKEQSMRPALAALAEQQKTIEMQARQIKALRQGLNAIARLAGVDQHPKFAALMKQADENNPVQPIPDPPSEAAPETTEEALAPAGTDDPTSIGASPVTDVAADATTDVLSTQVVLDEPLDLNEQDVQAPVAGTEGPRPLDEVKTETEIRVGDPNNPDTMFPLQGDFAQKATTGSMEGRTIASMRLARLRVQAGISNGDDLTLATHIAQSNASDEVIQAEINTLSQVLRTAGRQPAQARNLVPRSASRQRSAPSLSESFQAPEIQVVSAVDDSEILFE